MSHAHPHPPFVLYVALLALGQSNWQLACAQGSAEPGRPQSTTLAVETFQYDANGNQTLHAIAPFHGNFNLLSTTNFDALGRAYRFTDPSGSKIETRRAPNGSVNQVVDPRGLITQYQTDGLGNRVLEISPDTGTTQYNHDSAGNISAMTNAQGVSTNIAYDALNRLVAADYISTQGPTIRLSWIYDQAGPGYGAGAGRLTTAISSAAVLRYAYDAQGRAIEATQTLHAASGTNQSPISLQTRYSYNGAGKLIQIGLPSGAVTSFSYVAGQPSGIALNLPGNGQLLPLLSSIRVNAFSGIDGWDWRFSNGLQAHVREFDSHGRITSHPLGRMRRGIAYDPAGRVVALQHWDALTGLSMPSGAAMNQYFSYDRSGRLIAAVGAGESYAWNYDATGNRVSAQINGTATSFSINRSSNRIGYADPPSRQFSMDAVGNTVIDSYPRRAYTYHATGALAQAQIGNSYAKYDYDAFGRRIRKHTNAGPTTTQIFSYDLGHHLLGEYDQYGSPVREYVWLGDIPVAVITHPQGNGAAAVYIIHADHLNTPRAILDTSGRVRWQWISEPFGSKNADTNPEGMGDFVFNLRFPGQYWDTETGLNYNMARYYDPALGRYTQSDPIGLAGGINTYAYAESQPTSLTDPDGLATYMCRVPLHALTGALGKRLAMWTMSNVPMAHHRYLCVPGQCSGQDQRGEKWSDPLWGPGKKSNDEFNAEHCEQKEPDNTCIEKCVLRRLDGPRPTYGIPLATDCQEWAEEVLNSCRYECSSSISTDRPYIGYPSAGRRNQR